MAGYLESLASQSQSKAVSSTLRRYRRSTGSFRSEVRRPLAETNDGIHIVALLEMGIQVHWAVENVLSYSTRP